MKASAYIYNFEEIIANAATLLDFKEAMENDVVREKVSNHCPNVEKEPIFVADKVKQTIKNTGKILGVAFQALGGYLNQGVKYVGNYLETKIEEPTNKEGVDPSTK